MSKLYDLLKEDASGRYDENDEPSAELVAWYEENEWGDPKDDSGNMRELVYALEEGATLEGSPIITAKQWGGEGEGDSIGYVFQYGEDYVRVEGYYSSYDGAYWDDAEPEKVEPREVTVTEFFGI